MAIFYDISAAKKSLNLTINSDLASQARQLLGPRRLSSKVEELLVEVVREERQKSDVLATELSQAADFWNTFNEDHGSFADEYSTL